jgi:hypothetical protein
MKGFFTVTCVFIALIVTQFMSGCAEKKAEYIKVMHDPKLYSNVIHELSYVIIYDIFSPPVASRIYAYSNLAAFEVLANERKHFASLEGKVRDLNNIPHPATNSRIDYPFASLIALLKVGKHLTFSADAMQQIIDSVKLLAQNSGMPDTLFANSVTYGGEVADSILSWSKKDNYLQTRGFSFTVTGLAAPKSLFHLKP